MYDTVEEAKQKLEGSVVLYDNIPVYIYNVGGSAKKVILQYAKMPLTGTVTAQNLISVPITDPLWDFKTAGTRLGYVQVKGPGGAYDTVYTSRIPTRHSRQGLDQRTVNILQFDFDKSRYSYGWQDVIESLGFVDTIKNVYVNPVMAFKQVTGDAELYRAVPIHRKMVLSYDKVSPPYLIYRNEKIGYTEDGESFRLAKHKSYLKEELTDMIGLRIT